MGLFKIFYNFRHFLKKKKKKFSKKYFLLLSLLLYLNIINIFLNKIKNTKIAICTIGKRENLYVKQFVSYYIHLGIDHIFIYDDNEPKTEKISAEIEPKFKKFVTIYNKIGTQVDAYNDCYKRNNLTFNWLLFIDFDEFLYIKKYSLKYYLNKSIFKKCDFIHFHWVMATDNDLIHYDNRSLFERFKRPYIESGFIKSIIRGNIKDLKYYVHSPGKSPYKNISCNNNGKIINSKHHIEYITDIDVKEAYIIHFRFKSTEEFINKYKRGYGSISVIKNLSEEYFKYNKITKEKIFYL